MAALSRGAIIEAGDLKYEEVEVPEWGGSVRVRTLTAAEKDEFDQRWLAAKDRGETLSFRAQYCALCIVDESGARMFPGPNDPLLLARKSSQAIDRIWAVAQRLNGVTAEQVEAAEGN